MREYELIIDKALKNGLSPERILPTNTQYLKKCLGFRIGKAGIEAYKTLDNPLPATIDMFYNWPFPQFITGETYNFLIIRDHINMEDLVYQVSDDHSTINLIKIIDELTYGQGTLMEVVDFGKYIFMTNGVVMIYWDVDLNLWQDITSSTTIPMMRAICKFNGQAVGGNIVSTWYDCDETFYIWSKIGEFNFTIDSTNEAGYKRCPYGGTVYNVKQLGNNVIGYSSEGITLLSPVTDPVPSFGFKELSDIGLINKGAINGNLQRHIYLGEDYILREVTSEGIKELDYQHHMEELAGSEDIIISYESSEDNFYIGNSTKTFLLSPFGLTEIRQHPSTVWRNNSDAYILPDAEDSTEPYICTEPFDMNFRGQKTVFSMETDAFSVLDPEVGLDYINDLNTWNEGLLYKPINDQGIAAIISSGNMFRFRLRFEDIYDGLRLGYIKVRYKMTDLRGIRGVYAPPPRGQ